MKNSDGLYLSAREAAAELAISPATLYAYVSRGLIRSEPTPDSRKNRYRAEDVRALKERRVPSPEFCTEDGVLSGYKRGQAIAMGRDLQRNFAGVAAALNQFMLNAVGKGPKLRLHSKVDAAWSEKAAGWFNGTWTKSCDFRDDMHFGEMVGLLEVALKREGDALLVFDDFGMVQEIRCTIHHA